MSLDVSKGAAVKGLIAVLLMVSAAEFYVVQEQGERIGNLETELNDTREVLNTTQGSLQAEREENRRLQSKVNSQQEEIRELGDRLGVTQERLERLTPTVKRHSVVGVTGDGEGVVIPLEVKTVSGEGFLAMNIKNVDLKSGVQDSVRTAADVASDRTGKELSTRDVTVSFINRRDEIVSLDGSSAGAVVAVSMVAALDNRTIDTDILMTGSINRDGSIGPVGGVEEKARAARDHGAETFLVPRGEYVEVDGIRVREVRDLDEAVRRMLG